MGEELREAPKEPDIGELLPPPPEPELSFGSENRPSNNHKNKYTIIGIAVILVVVIAVVFICINLFGKNKGNGQGLKTSMSIGGAPGSIVADQQPSSAVADIQSSVTGTSSSSLPEEDNSENKDDDEGYQYESGGQKTDLAGITEGVMTDGQWESVKLVAGVYTAADEEIIKSAGKQPTIALNDDCSFSMQLTTGDSIVEVTGIFTCTERESEQDGILVTLYVIAGPADMPTEGQMAFGDTPDYCVFMTGGFGIMGYDNDGEPPYGFVRQ